MNASFHDLTEARARAFSLLSEWLREQELNRQSRTVLALGALDALDVLLLADQRPPISHAAREVVAARVFELFVRLGPPNNE